MIRAKLSEDLLQVSSSREDPAGGSYRSLSLSAARSLAESHGLAVREVELAALEAEIIPERYQRNMGTVGPEGQARLLRSGVAVIGAGGLGGFVIELLARMGVGRLVIVDDDTFSESNLNRQLLALDESMGEDKAQTACKRVNLVNGAVEVQAFTCRADADSLDEILSECDVAVDCLDNLPSRFDLEEACSRLGLTLVHGAIAGFLGQLAVIRPGKPLLAAIYGPLQEGGRTKGIETKVGNPAVTPAMLAAWQASETVKIIARLEGVIAEGRMLVMDMQSGMVQPVDLELG